MTYHHLMILCHRPWTSRSSQPSRNHQPGFQHARSVCNSSASAITTLLRKYESQYTFRRMNVFTVHTILSAALITIFDHISRQRKNATEEFASPAAAELSVYFRALDELGRSFDLARRTREYLVAIQKRWQELAGDRKLGSKRRFSRQLHKKTKRAKSVQTY